VETNEGEGAVFIIRLNEWKKNCIVTIMINISQAGPTGVDHKHYLNDKIITKPDGL
jgi:hypothetical protein